MRKQLRGIQDQEMITLSEMIYSMAVDCPTGSCREEGLRAEGEGLSAGVRTAGGRCKVSLFCQFRYRTPRSPKILDLSLTFQVVFTVYLVKVKG